MYTNDEFETPIATPATPSGGGGGTYGGGFSETLEFNIDDLDNIALPTPPLGKPPSPPGMDMEMMDGRIPSPPMGRPPSPPFGRPGGEDGDGGDGEGEEGMMDEFRSLIERLVRQVMPAEVDNIDELIEEYEGRETELLDTLTSMRNPDDPRMSDSDDDDEDDDDNNTKGSTLAAGTTMAVIATGAGVTRMGTSLSDSDDDDDDLEKIQRPLDEISVPSDKDDSKHRMKEIERQRKQQADKARKKEERRKRREENREKDRKLYMVASCLACLIILGLGIALGIIFGIRSKETREVSELEEEDLGNEDNWEVNRPDPQPEDAPTKPDPGGPVDHNDDYDESDLPTPCNTLPETKIQSLGVDDVLEGSYPTVAIDGTQAIVATTSGEEGGRVAFFSFNMRTNEWARTEIFGTNDIGEIKSVAISGSTAVVGAPLAYTDIGSDSEPMQTGAVFLYEQDGNGKWQQLKGAYTAEEYTNVTTREMYVNATVHFGHDVAIEDDVMVASSPEENDKEGSVTVFVKEKKKWVQLERIRPNNLCRQEYFGYSVEINKDMIAISADCDTNMVLYRINRNDNGKVDSLTKTQELLYVSKSWGAVSSISMSWDTLVYSTVAGGLFFYNVDRRDSEGREKSYRYFRSQEMSFDTIRPPNALYEYPVSIDANMLALSRGNEVYIYTQNKGTREWRREKLVLENKGDFAGYVGAPVALSDGMLMVASAEDVTSNDFTDCARESAAPSPFPTFSPTAMPTEDPDKPTCIVVSLTFDKNPQDTSYVIEAIDGYVVGQSIAFDEALADYKQPHCLPPGNYAFIARDEYNDGMCCDDGVGSYNVTFQETGDVIAKGGKFGAEDRTMFTMPYDPNNKFVGTWSPTRQPTPAPTAKPTLASNSNANPPASSPILSQIVGPPAPPSSTPKPTPMPAPTATTEDCHTLYITVNLDRYPADTRWEIIPQGQSAPISTSPAFDASQALTPDTQMVCLEEGTYDFIIYDQYGDGICCTYGQGSYELAFEDGVVIASGDSFGFSETTTIATPVQNSTPLTPKPTTAPPTPSPTPAPIPACYDVSVTLTFDKYSDDESWDIRQDGNIVAQSPVYAANLAQDVQELCLPAGDYDFTIYDRYGDGMCCDWGDGSYSVTTDDGGLVLAEGGEFGPDESTSFTLPAAR